MSRSARELLRLHIEAVWGVRLPPVTGSRVALLPNSMQPPWAVYVAEVAGARICCWRADVAVAARNALEQRAWAALEHNRDTPPDAGVTREVALHWAAAPTVDATTASSVARVLGSADRDMLEASSAGAGTHYLDEPRRVPVVGVVREGRLISIAHSARQTDEACELGIETAAELRRQGYGLAATVLWSAMVVARGKLPLYSAFAENEASLALAAAAGYRPFARAAYVRA